jgi:trk system potassium uptake protein TrkA
MTRIIIVGGERTAYHLARQFIENHHHVTIINRSRDDSRELFRETDATVVWGDGSSPDVLAEAGARRADVIIALTPHDQDNLIACQVAKRMYGVPRTVAIVNDPDNEEIFTELDVDIAFSAAKIVASLVEQQATFDDIVKLMPIAEGGITITEVRLEEKSPAVRRTVQELNLSGSTLIAGLIREGQAQVPSGATRIEVGDRLIVITQPETYEEDMRKITGHS